jgi:hypothetical protein
MVQERGKKNDKDAVTTAEASAELKKLRADARFQANRKSLAILRYLGEPGRPFDPDLDAIDPGEAARLRRSLLNYYDGGGRLNPVRIDLSEDSHSLIFTRIERGKGSNEAEAPSLPLRAPSRINHLRGIASVYPLWLFGLSVFVGAGLMYLAVTLVR